jgi:aldose 1-epimerase
VWSWDAEALPVVPAWRAGFQQQQVPVVELAAGAQRLVLTPRGGSVLEYAAQGRAIFRPALADAVSQPFARAGFPMLPFVNRIANGSFTAAGRAVHLAPNVPGERHPLHGQVFLRDWQITAQTSHSLSMDIQGGGDAWPWRYRAHQHFVLDGRSLGIELQATNTDSVPAPMALGLHPYFPAAAEATLQARTGSTWEIDAESLPVRRMPVPSGMGFDPPRGVAAMRLDHSFGDWDGAALLCWPDYSVALRFEGGSWLHVYVPVVGDFFCLEPQTAAPAALNRGGAELRWLQPGEALSVRAHFSVQD